MVLTQRGKRVIAAAYLLCGSIVIFHHPHPHHVISVVSIGDYTPALQEADRQWLLAHPYHARASRERVEV